jgi:uncharacterized membrane protein YfcA
MNGALLPAHPWPLAALVVFAAAALQAVTGFGFNMLAAPLLALLFSPRLTVPALLLLWLPLGGALTWRCRRDASPRRVGFLLAAAALGLLPGAWLLRTVDTRLLAAGIGIVSTLTALGLWRMPVRRFPREAPGLTLAGIASGVLCTASAQSGPPVVLFGLLQGWEPARFRADLIAYFTLVSVPAAAVLVGPETLNVEAVQMALLLAPPAALGSWLGHRVAARLDPAGFRGLALAVIGAAGLTPVARLLLDR